MGSSIQNLIEQAAIQIQSILSDEAFVDDVRWNDSEFQFEIRTVEHHLATFHYTPEASLTSQVTRFIKDFKEDYL